MVKFTMPDAEGEPVKKGRPSWKPARKLDVTGKSSDYRYRYVSTDYANLQKKLAEGWQFVNPISGIPGEHNPNAREISDGKQLDSIQKYRELVLMAMPEEMALERDAYYSGKSKNRSAVLENSLQSDLDKAARESGSRHIAKAHGSIKIGA